MGIIRHKRLLATREREFPRDLVDQIEELIRAGHGGTAIHRLLQAEFPERDNIPKVRTLQREVAERRPPRWDEDLDESGEWSSTDMPGEDARVVLELLNQQADEMNYWGGYQPDHMTFRGADYLPTHKEAQNIAWIRKAAPTMPLTLVQWFARLFILQPSGKAAAGLTWFVAMCPWDGQEATDLYVNTVKKGIIPTLPVKGSEVIPWWIYRQMFHRLRKEE